MACNAFEALFFDTAFKQTHIARLHASAVARYGAPC